MTILEVIQRSAEFLTRKGVASPRLQVELLLAHLLKMPRMNLYLNFERPVSVAELDALRELVRRRGQREPLQYIVGSTSFCGLELMVNPHVLIPRPETELLAERAWKFLQQFPADAAPRALDLGTGSGCLAIILATKAPKAQVHALDISGEALAVARQNAARHSPQVEFHQGDGFAALPPDTQFDLILSNPPYIPSAEIETLEPEVKDFEPHGALDGGGDGMDFYRHIAESASRFLTPNGCLMLELNDHGSEIVREIFQKEHWTVDAIEPDYNGFPRILVAHRATQSHDVAARI